MNNKIIGLAGFWTVLFVVFVGLIPSHYMPHARCWNYDIPLIAGGMSSNLAIALSYGMISGVLWQIDRKAKLRHKHFMFIGFATFVFFCGLTHVMDLLTVWYPLYWLDVAVRWLCAIPSIVVAVYLWGLRKQIILVLSYVRANWEEVTRVLAVAAETEPEV